jgi:hypothetical protein
MQKKSPGFEKFPAFFYQTGFRVHWLLIHHPEPGLQCLRPRIPGKKCVSDRPAHQRPDRVPHPYPANRNPDILYGYHAYARPANFKPWEWFSSIKFFSRPRSA